MSRSRSRETSESTCVRSLTTSGTRIYVRVIAGGERTLPLVVQKFGGSSVATAERIMAAARRSIRARQAGSDVIVVVSARGDTTDELIALARQISEQPP